MRRQQFLALVLIAVLSTACPAQSKTPSLTSQEISQGWILLWDGKTTFGWTSPNESKWTILDGMLAPQSGKPGLLVTTTVFGDYELSMEYRISNSGRLQVIANADAQGNEVNKGTALNLSERAAIPGNPGWVELRLEIKGGRIVREEYDTKGVLGGVGSARKSDFGPREDHPHSGHLALAGNGFIVRNLKLKPLGTHSLFNGKDLTGWKEFPGRKSKFTVTREGWLNIQNGNGDLQTEGQWADFVLQLECKTHGKHLNSGVFFRCLPNQYQQGYEAQIHNGFTEQPMKEYTLDIFDPKTNTLKEKKKVKSTSLDYGTGAIYRRVPARFQVAKDNEWFTMTVVAHGKHLATWVNGVQVVDWTDHRPLANNGRNGCYLKAGPISLQGHDPTTNLSFRNFRLAELGQAPLKK